MLVAPNLAKYLAEEAERYCKVVEHFTKELAVYEDEAPDAAADLKTKEAYGNAVEVCDEWLRRVLLAELMEYDGIYEVVSVRLLLPDHEIQRRITVSYSSEYNTSHGVESVPELIQFPLGQMDDYTYRCLRGFHHNPLKLLYEHLYKCSRNIHHILCKYGDYEGIMDRGVLETHCIQDPLGIYKLDKLLSAGVAQLFGETV